MKKVENIVLTAVLILLFAFFIMMWLGALDNTKTQIAEKEQIELAKQDIVTEYGFDPILWIGAEKIDNLEGRDDFYIFTCLVDEGELVEYRFAVMICEVNGEVDVDTWRIKEAT